MGDIIPRFLGFLGNLGTSGKGSQFGVDRKTLCGGPLDTVSCHSLFLGWAFHFLLSAFMTHQ
jgi:hypothetical protein